jgi:hypothetical protein
MANAPIFTPVPANLRKHISGIGDEVEFIGKGNSAIVIRTSDSKRVIKIYGHKRYNEDPYVTGKIAAQFDNEIRALTQIPGHRQKIMPAMMGHGRIHPFEMTPANDVWQVGTIHGWVGLEYIPGETQDYVAQQRGLEYSQTEKSATFFQSIGSMLGKFHKIGKQVKAAFIHHNVHETEWKRVQLFQERYASRAAARPHVLDEIKELFDAVRAEACSATLVHGDVASRNFIYERASNGQPVAKAIIDFGLTGIGLPEVDFVQTRWGDNPDVVAAYNKETGGMFNPRRYNLLVRLSRTIDRYVNGS